MIFGMDFGVVLRSKLEPKSTKNRSKAVSKLRCKFECIFEGSWTPVAPSWEAKMGPTWAKLGLKMKRKEEVEAEGQENEEQEDLQGFARICRIC